MPSINFDIFYDTDTLNFTASRGTTAPKAKPAWKVRSAPKLPPKEPPQPAAAKAFGPKSSQSKPDQPKESTPAPKKKAPKLEVRNKKPATSSVGSAVGGYVDKAIGGAVATAGEYAGSAVSGVGHSINGVGRGIESSIRYYGDGVRDYGNGIKDYTKADGQREQTAGNPLGLGSPGSKSGLQWRSQPPPTRSEIKAPKSTPKQGSKTPAAKSSAPVKRTASAPTTSSKPPASKPAASKPASAKSTSGKVTISNESKPPTKRKTTPKAPAKAK